MKILTFVFLLLILANGFAVESLESSDGSLSTAESQANINPLSCPSAELFSDVTYESLRTKLDKTFKEKNNSLVLVDFRALQAQIDVLSSHLLIQDKLTSKEAQTVLKKSISHLDQLQSLLAKAKEAARTLKEDQVVPLATLTSLKAEADACNLVSSPYGDIFKLLSQLNKELNEILMTSEYKIQAQREKVQNLLQKIKSTDEESPVSNQSIAESFNFIQKNILSITKTFEFDPTVLLIAKH